MPFKYVDDKKILLPMTPKTVEFFDAVGKSQLER